MEKVIARYRGQGKLILENNEAATVKYSFEEFQEFDGEVPTLRDRRGRVSHAAGHPDWHPMLSLHPLTLVLTDGRKLKVILRNLQGDFQGTGDFF